MKTFQVWPLLPLGSTFLSEPYQTASARPAPPALIHGKTFTASPVADDPSLTCTGGVQTFQPDAAEAALTNTCRCPGFERPASTAQATKRLRAAAVEALVPLLASVRPRTDEVVVGRIDQRRRTGVRRLMRRTGRRVVHGEPRAVGAEAGSAAEDVLRRGGPAVRGRRDAVAHQRV